MRLASIALLFSLACSAAHELPVDGGPDARAPSTALCALDADIAWCVGTSHPLCGDRSFALTVLTFSYAWSPASRDLVAAIDDWRGPFYEAHRVRFADLLIENAARGLVHPPDCAAWWSQTHSYELWRGPTEIPAAYRDLPLPVVLVLDADANVLWSASGTMATSDAVQSAVRAAL